MLTLVHPVLFHLGAILIPSYGAMAALGVLLALFLAQRTARIAVQCRGGVESLRGRLVRGACGTAAAVAVAELERVRRHPSWMMGLAMIHHPLLGAAGALAGLAAAAAYARWRGLPLWTTADALAAPLALGLAL